jgi:hypothetical protein
MKAPITEKAWGKVSQVVQSPKLHTTRKRMQEVLYLGVSTNRARTMTISTTTAVTVISSGLITVLAHNKLSMKA